MDNTLTIQADQNTTINDNTIIIQSSNDSTPVVKSEYDYIGNVQRAKGKHWTTSKQFNLRKEATSWINKQKKKGNVIDSNITRITVIK